MILKQIRFGQRLKSLAVLQKNSLWFCRNSAAKCGRVGVDGGPAPLTEVPPSGSVLLTSF
jgi:hypothetical protein